MGACVVTDLRSGQASAPRLLFWFHPGTRHTPVYAVARPLEQDRQPVRPPVFTIPDATYGFHCSGCSSAVAGLKRPLPSWSLAARCKDWPFQPIAIDFLPRRPTSSKINRGWTLRRIGPALRKAGLFVEERSSCYCGLGRPGLGRRGGAVATGSKRFRRTAGGSLGLARARRGDSLVGALGPGDRRRRL